MVLTTEEFFLVCFLFPYFCSIYKVPVQGALFFLWASGKLKPQYHTEGATEEKSVYIRHRKVHSPPFPTCLEFSQLADHPGQPSFNNRLVGHF